VLVVIIAGGGYLFLRYNKNKEQIVPYPYVFETKEAWEISAPIVMIGDRMGEQLARFETELAAKISENLAKPIELQTLAKEGLPLHRTVHQLKGIGKWPQIVLYQGASEEWNEELFIPSEVQWIKKNFELFQDDRLQTLLILYPELSRLLYHPIEYKKLGATPPEKKEWKQDEYLARLELKLKIFELELLDMINLSRDRNSLLILTTTPVNLDIPPREVCEISTNLDIEAEMEGVRELIRKKDHKGALTRSTELVAKYPGNAALYYLHGQVSKRLGLRDQAINALKQAAAYDCLPWRATEVYNGIIRKVAREQQVLLFDFASFMEKDWGSNVTYFNEIYPQNLYYQRAVDQLGILIRRILKL
jgi:tetratricopeptide (TPR) repeat protein